MLPSARVFVTSLLAGVALAKPLAGLQDRQVPTQQSICAESYYASCSNTALVTSAQAWCASLGYGTTVLTSTVTGSGTTLLRK